MPPPKQEIAVVIPKPSVNPASYKPFDDEVDKTINHILSEEASFGSSGNPDWSGDGFSELSNESSFHSQPRVTKKSRYFKSAPVHSSTKAQPRKQRAAQRSITRIDMISDSEASESNSNVNGRSDSEEDRENSTRDFADKSHEENDGDQDMDVSMDMPERAYEQSPNRNGQVYENEVNDADTAEEDVIFASVHESNRTAIIEFVVSHPFMKTPVQPVKRSDRRQFISEINDKARLEGMDENHLSSFVAYVRRLYLDLAEVPVEFSFNEDDNDIPFGQEIHEEDLRNSRPRKHRQSSLEPTAPAKLKKRKIAKKRSPGGSAPLEHNKIQAKGSHDDRGAERSSCGPVSHENASYIQGFRENAKSDKKQPDLEIQNSLPDRSDTPEFQDTQEFPSVDETTSNLVFQDGSALSASAPPAHEIPFESTNDGKSPSPSPFRIGKDNEKCNGSALADSPIASNPQPIHDLAPDSKKEENKRRNRRKRQSRRRKSLDAPQNLESYSITVAAHDHPRSGQDSHVEDFEVEVPTVVTRPRRMGLVGFMKTNDLQRMTSCDEEKSKYFTVQRDFQVGLLPEGTRKILQEMEMPPDFLSLDFELSDAPSDLHLEEDLPLPAVQISPAKSSYCFSRHATPALDTPVKGTHLRPEDPRTPLSKASKTSPYFPRLLADSQSCLPFPPIDAPSFGLVQEQLAHEPFKLLIATIFLNRTRGGVALPVLFKVFERYPTIDAMATADPSEFVEMIRCLGFQNQRARKCIALAQTWLANPPSKDKRYRKMHYPANLDGRDVGRDECIVDEDHRIAWEIAHLPGVGAYALDSWRIFCRDELRGLANDWQGTGARMPGFVPEWKSVLPQDKELRAYLTWLWLKEGWVWDRHTGDLAAANDKMLRAARTGGVAHEEDGNWVLQMSPVKAANGLHGEG